MTTAMTTVTMARALNRVATAQRVRRKRPSLKARIPVRVHRRPGAIATTVARAHLRRCTHKDTTTMTVNRKSGGGAGRQPDPTMTSVDLLSRNNRGGGGGGAKRRSGGGGKPGGFGGGGGGPKRSGSGGGGYGR